MARALSAYGAPRFRVVLTWLWLIAAALTVGPTHGAAQDRSMQQVTLTEKQVLDYIAASQAISAFTGRKDGKVPNRRDPDIQAKLDGLARQNGFTDYAEFNKTAVAILDVMIRIDPHTKRFVDSRGE